MFLSAVRELIAGASFIDRLAFVPPPVRRGGRVFWPEERNGRPVALSHGPGAHSTHGSAMSARTARAQQSRAPSDESARGVHLFSFPLIL